MNCKKCNSENVNVQKVTITKTKKKGLMYWLLFGWLIDVLLFLFWTIPFLLIKLLFPKKVKTKVYTAAVCQSCGHSWKL